MTVYEGPDLSAVLFREEHAGIMCCFPKRGFMMGPWRALQLVTDSIWWLAGLTSCQDASGPPVNILIMVPRCDLLGFDEPRPQMPQY